MVNLAHWWFVARFNAYRNLTRTWMPFYGYPLAVAAMWWGYSLSLSVAAFCACFPVATWLATVQYTDFRRSLRPTRTWGPFDIRRERVDVAKMTLYGCVQESSSSLVINSDKEFPLCMKAALEAAKALGVGLLIEPLSFVVTIEHHDVSVCIEGGLDHRELLEWNRLMGYKTIDGVVHILHRQYGEVVLSNVVYPADCRSCQAPTFSYLCDACQSTHRPPPRRQSVMDAFSLSSTS